jgi:hypothetical protein
LFYVILLNLGLLQTIKQFTSIFNKFLEDYKFCDF